MAMGGDLDSAMTLAVKLRPSLLSVLSKATKVEHVALGTAVQRVIFEVWGSESKSLKSVSIFPEPKVAPLGLQHNYTAILLLSSQMIPPPFLTHVHFENQSFFLEPEVVLGFFPHITHIAWSMSGDSATTDLKDVSNLVSRSVRLPPQIMFAVVHILNGENSKPDTQRLRKTWEVLLSPLKWDPDRWTILVDNVSYPSVVQCDDVWRHANYSDGETETLLNETRGCLEGGDAAEWHSSMIDPSLFDL